MAEDDDNYQLAADDDAPTAPSASAVPDQPDTGSRCQQCGTPMALSAIICGQCGYNHQTGRTISSGKKKEQANDEDGPLYQLVYRILNSGFPFGKVIALGLAITFFYYAYGWYAENLGFTARVEAVEVGTAYTILSTGERQGNFSLDLRKLAEEPDKPGAAIRSPFGHLGVTGDIDNRFTIGGRDKLVIVEPTSGKESRDVLLRIRVSHRFLLDNGLKSMDEVILRGDAFTLDFGNGHPVPGTMLGWVMDNPTVVNIGSAKASAGEAITPAGCTPSSKKIDREKGLGAGWLGPEVGVYTFADDEDCKGVFSYKVPPPMPGFGGGGASGFQDAQGKLDINAPFDKPVTVFYEGSFMVIKAPETTRAWWSTENKYVHASPYGLGKEQLVVIFKRPPRASRKAVLYCRESRIGWVDTWQDDGEILLERDLEREAWEEEQKQQRQQNGPPGFISPF